MLLPTVRLASSTKDSKLVSRVPRHVQNSRRSLKEGTNMLGIIINEQGTRIRELIMHLVSLVLCSVLPRPRAVMVWAGTGRPTRSWPVLPIRVVAQRTRVTGEERGSGSTAKLHVKRQGQGLTRVRDLGLELC